MYRIFLLSQQKKVDKYYQEIERIENLCQYEKEYSQYDFICGIDEVGRGPLAGPVVAGAVVLPKGSRILYINDSKKLSAKKREELFDIIKEEAVSVGIGMASPERIDEINILQATYEAMRQAIANLSVKPELLLNDAVMIPGVDIKQVPIIKGDAKSIFYWSGEYYGKGLPRHMMEEYDKVFPGYDFASNKGYGSKEHIEALHRLVRVRFIDVVFLKIFYKRWRSNLCERILEVPQKRRQSFFLREKVFAYWRETFEVTTEKLILLH